MKIYMHTISWKKPDEPNATGQAFYTSDVLDEVRRHHLAALAQSYGFVLEGEINVEIETDAAARIGEVIESSIRRQLDLIEGAKPDYDDARLNELERELRNHRRATDAKLDGILAMLSVITGAPTSNVSQAQMLNEAQDRIIAAAAAPIRPLVGQPHEYEAGDMLARAADGTIVPATARAADGTIVRAIGRVPLVPVNVPPVPPEAVQQFAATATYAQPVEPAQLTPQMMQAQQKGFPLANAPLPPIVGDPTVSSNPNARASGRTPEMSSGVMRTVGPSPTSQVFSFSGKVDGEGKPVFDRHDLPKVGDSLRSPSLNSDIKVP